MLGCNAIREVGGQRRVSRQLTKGQLYPPQLTNGQLYPPHQLYPPQLTNGQLYRVCGSSGCPRS